MKAVNLPGLTALTVLLLFLWTDRAQAHGLPLFLLPVLGSFLFFPVALFSALLGWLAKGLYYLDRTGKKSLSMVAWSEALKEAGLMYLCFALAAFILDLGIAFVMDWSRWWEAWGLTTILAVTTILSALATMFLHRRLLERIEGEEEHEKDRESLRSAKPWQVVSLGLISPAVFASIMFVLVGFRL